MKFDKTIKILLNGNSHCIEEGCSVEKLLDSIGLKSNFFAVALNRTIVSRSQFKTVLLQEGDELEIVHPVGGG